MRPTGVILQWALLAATVGMLLKMIEERAVETLRYSIEFRALRRAWNTQDRARRDDLMLYYRPARDSAAI